MKYTWLWTTHCNKCGYKSKFYGAELIARIIALWHTITQHPYGYMTIPCVDIETYKKNREHKEKP